MRHLLKIEDAYTTYEHHDFFLAEEQPKPEPVSSSSSRYNSTTATTTATTTSSSRSARPACNKQTINAGDNPCPSFQSPLPYMLAGLAAMVLLVVISLMILACSYLRGYFSNEEENGDQAGHRGSGSADAAQAGAENSKAAGLFASQDGFGNSPEKIVVILAGQDKPTHLAQPVELPKLAGDDIDHQDHDACHQMISPDPPPPPPPADPAPPSNR